MKRCNSLPDSRVAYLSKRNESADKLTHPSPKFMRHLATWLMTLYMACASNSIRAFEINQASEADLDSLKGVGPATTARILAERQKSAFVSWTDLMSRLKGVRVANATKLSAQGLRVNGQPFAATENNSGPPHHIKAKPD